MKIGTSLSNKIEKIDSQIKENENIDKFLNNIKENEDEVQIDMEKYSEKENENLVIDTFMNNQDDFLLLRNDSPVVIMVQGDKPIVLFCINISEDLSKNISEKYDFIEINLSDFIENDEFNEMIEIDDELINSAVRKIIWNTSYKHSKILINFSKIYFKEAISIHNNIKDLIECDFYFIFLEENKKIEEFKSQAEINLIENNILIIENSEQESEIKIKIRNFFRQYNQYSLLKSEQAIIG